VFSKPFATGKDYPSWAVAFGLRWQSDSDDSAFGWHGAFDYPTRSQSGFALRLPPQSKISHFETYPEIRRGKPLRDLVKSTAFNFMKQPAKGKFDAAALRQFGDNGFPGFGVNPSQHPNSTLIIFPKYFVRMLPVPTSYTWKAEYCSQLRKP
jgi:hypothetical protein